MIRKLLNRFNRIRFYGHRFTVLSTGSHIFGGLWALLIYGYAIFDNDTYLFCQSRIALCCICVSLLLNYSFTWAKPIVHPLWQLLINRLLLQGSALIISYHAATLIYYAMMIMLGNENPFGNWWIPTFLPIGISILTPAIYHWFTTWVIAMRMFKQFDQSHGNLSFAGPAAYRDRNVKYVRGSGGRTNDIILGSTTYNYTAFPKLVAERSDSNMLTLGSVGSGKKSVIANIMGNHNSSLIINDPKSELVQLGYHRRSKSSGTFKAKCFNLAPYGIQGNPSIPTHSYNIFSEVDLNKPEQAAKLLRVIAEAMVLEESSSSSGRHFTEVPRTLLAAFCGHVLTTQPKKNHHLGFVVDVINGIDSYGIADPKRFEETLMDMRCNDALGGMIQAASKTLTDVGERERGGFLSTLNRSISWAMDDKMIKHLSGESDLRFSDIGVDGYSTTVFICLPFSRMTSQSRWIRVITNLAITLMRDRKKAPETPTLYIVDEAPQLGKLDTLARAYSTERSSGTKLWMFAQNWGQLTDLYGDDMAQSFISSSTCQFFGVADHKTAKMISELLGTTQVDGRTRQLMTPAEIMSEFGKDANRQIIRPASVDGGREVKPFYLERLTYIRYRTDFSAYPGQGRHFPNDSGLYGRWFNPIKKLFLFLFTSKQPKS